MTFWKGTKAELVTLPFYLGLIHVAVPQLVLYSGVAGTAMAGGEFAEQARLQAGGVRLFLANVAVWVTVIGVFGGLTYLFALLF